MKEYYYLKQAYGVKKVLVSSVKRRMHRYYLRHKDEILARNKAYWLKHKKEIMRKMTIYAKNKYHTDPVYRRKRLECSKRYEAKKRLPKSN